LTIIMDKVGILAINPGSTTTKVAVYLDTDVVFTDTISHTHEELHKFGHVSDQFEYRKKLIMEQIKISGIDKNIIYAVVGRGGLLKPIESGVYSVNDKMKHDLTHCHFGEHASNLGGLLADELAKLFPKAKAYIANPIVVDEMEDIARISGHPLFERRSVFHALNQKAVANIYAKSTDRDYNDLNLIVAHIGGGISIGAHEKGRVVDVNQALDGEGPLSPERSGTLPAGDLIRECFRGEYNEEQMLEKVTGDGGFVAYLGTNSAIEVEKRISAGDEKASLIFRAMAYQVAKMIGAMFTVLKGDVDVILLTGGVAHSKLFVSLVTERINKLAPVNVYPGEDEMHAMAMNGLGVVTGEIEVKEYV